jgi:hypothetical protein
MPSDDQRSPYPSRRTSDYSHGRTFGALDALTPNQSEPISEAFGREQGKRSFSSPMTWKRLSDSPPASLSSTRSSRSARVKDIVNPFAHRDHEVNPGFCRLCQKSSVRDATEFLGSDSLGSDGPEHLTNPFRDFEFSLYCLIITVYNHF